MAVFVVREDGARVDVTDKPEVLDLIEHINGEQISLNKVFSEEVTEEDAEEPIMVLGDHAITETVEFTLRGTGWRFIRARINLDDGSTTVMLGR